MNLRDRIEAKVEAKTSKLRDKVAGKVAGKVAAKCGKGAKACAAVALVAALVAGCHMGEVPTAQRAQTSSVRDNVFNISYVLPSNAVAGADAPALRIDIGNLAQANETSGTETMSNSPSNAPVVDVKPDIDASYSPLGGTTQAANDWVKSLSQDSASALAGALRAKLNGTFDVKKADGTTETVTCKDGVCTNAAGDCVNCRE